MAFEGGERLKNHLKYLKQLRKPGRVEVGFFDPTLASLALYMEFGFINAQNDKFVAPRPFFRSCIENNRDAWFRGFSNMLESGMSSKDALKNVGKVMRLHITYYLVQGWLWRKNAPKTIEKKGFDRPLFETGRIQKSVKLKVVMGKVTP